MRLVFAGTPEVALPTLDAIAASGHDLAAVVTRPDAPSGHDLAAVVTRPDAPSGRARRLLRSPVGQWADERGIEVLTPHRPREPEFQDRLRAIAPDCVPVVAYGALVPPAALVIPRLGWVNLHFSLLPAWRGAAPVQHAVLHGDEVTGACVFQLEEGLDTGPVYGALTDEIRPTDTAGDLLERLAVSGAKLMVGVLDGLADGRAVAVPQAAEGVSLAPKLTVDDARIRWGDPAFAVDRRVRACTPAPGAWTTLRGERAKLGPLRPVRAEALPAGEIRVERDTVLVGTATTPVALGEVRPAGKKPMPAAAWLRGLRLAEGERFE